MDRKKYLSWIIALAMAMSVFAIPSTGFAAEESAQDDVSAEVTVDTQEQEAAVAVDEADAVIDETDVADDESIEAETPNEGAVEESEAINEEESEPQMSIESKSITAKAYNYAGFLNFYETIVEYADYDAQTIYGELPSVDQYNEETGKQSVPWGMNLSSEMLITIAVGTQKYSVRPDVEDRFSVKFKKVALGTPVTITYSLHGATRQEKMVVSKEVEPTVICRSVAYDGKLHGPTKNNVTVKVGKQTLSKSDFYLEDNYLFRGLAWNTTA